MVEHFDTLEFLVDRVKPDDKNNNYNSGPTLEPDGKTMAHTAVAILETVNTQTENRIRSKYLLCFIKPLNPELNPICYLLALLAHHFLHVSRIMVKSLTLRFLMSYIYGAHILDVSRSHTTTQHSR